MHNKLLSTTHTLSKLVCANKRNSWILKTFTTLNVFSGEELTVKYPEMFCVYIQHLKELQISENSVLLRLKDMWSVHNEQLMQCFQMGQLPLTQTYYVNKRLCGSFCITLSNENAYMEGMFRNKNLLKQERRGVGAGGSLWEVGSWKP